ncbi:putative BsuMI modification methylase subunit YdiO [Rosistilla carotiformis]|uniref:DNA (cytosine-5-)-methyltransferase n=1 Tax=Rosistilla carotiformis TaxID=2528017 RepID=A0A518JRD2_9BACT|nr:DNA cytosine methyltransferase [Rosistilla carotiformis]QDV68098.1 putative BsuMI modification methylase subunit YdiO [Rosistilla carotiformis]
MQQEIRTCDLFCGVGGSSRGAAMAGATPVAGLDMWGMATDAYAVNFPCAQTYRMKASSLKPQRLMDDVGKIDLLLASPECTAHSVAKGKKPGCEKSRGTAFEVIRFAKVLHPRWIVVENVLQMQRWARFDEWKSKLQSLGYHINSGVLDARYFSTPTSRRRLFVVCDREQEPSLPDQKNETKKTVSSILGRGESNSSPWPLSEVRTPERALATLERAERAIESLGDNTPFIMVYYGSDGAGGYQRLDRPLRTVTTLDRFAYVRPTKFGHEMRMLQPTELAAAMGFPTEHQLPKSTRREKIKLIGNAVCPRVMAAVVKTLTTPREAESKTAILRGREV